MKYKKKDGSVSTYSRYQERCKECNAEVCKEYYKKVGRPRKGEEATVPVTIRLEPKHEELLKKEFGSVQSFLDYMVRQGAIDKVIKDRN